jgi:hypothetical protein
MITTNEKPKISKSGTSKIKNGSKKRYSKSIEKENNIPTKIVIDKTRNFELEKTSFNTCLCNLVPHIPGVTSNNIENAITGTTRLLLNVDNNFAK